MFEENTRILVPGKGYVKITEAAEGDLYWDSENPMMVDASEEVRDDLVKITLINGHEIEVAGDVEFLVMEKRLAGDTFIKARDLNERHLAYYAGNTIPFDAMNLEPFRYINILSSEEIGMLSALATKTFIGGSRLEITKSRKEVHQFMENVLGRMGVAYSKELVEGRAPKLVYTLKDEAFCQELLSIMLKLHIPPMFWRSKEAMRGMLKGLFTYATFGGQMLILKDGKDSSLLKEIQAVLLLFGVNSASIGGLRAGKLIVSKNNAYRFAYRIGILGLKELFGPLDYKKFLEYNDREYSDTKYERVSSVKPVAAKKTCYSVGKGIIMANGMVLRSI